MKNFIKTIGLTFHSGDFYKKIKDEKTGDGVIFLLKIALFISVCIGVIGIIILLISSPIIKKKVASFIEVNFPSDLIVTIKDGKMTTNTNQPFFIPIPSSSKDVVPKENIFAILPGETADATILLKYHTMMAMTSDGFVAEQNNGSEIRILKYNNISVVASRETALSALSKIIPFFLIFFALGIIPFMMVIILFTMVFHLIWLFFVALLIWGFLRLKELDISYKQSYKIGIYAIVPLLFVEIIVFPFPFSGKLFTIAIMLAVVLISTRNWKKDEVQISTNTTEDKSVAI